MRHINQYERENFYGYCVPGLLFSTSEYSACGYFVFSLAVRGKKKNALKVLSSGHSCKEGIYCSANDKVDLFSMLQHTAEHFPCSLSSCIPNSQSAVALFWVPLDISYSQMFIVLHFVAHNKRLFVFSYWFVIVFTWMKTRKQNGTDAPSLKLHVARACFLGVASPLIPVDFLFLGDFSSVLLLPVWMLLMRAPIFCLSCLFLQGLRPFSDVRASSS